MKKFLESPWAGVFIFVTALLARGSLAESAHFMGDQATFFHIILGIRQGHEFPVMTALLSGGPAQLPGATFLYLLSLSQWISPTPEAANLEASLLCSIGVWLFWSALKTEFGKKLGPKVGATAAFVPALLMAVSPWSVLYGEVVDNGFVMSFLVGLAFWAAVKVRSLPGTRWIALFVGACATMPQFHLSAPIVWVGLLVLLWPCRRRLNWRWAALGAAVGLALYVPYLLHELQTDGSNWRAYQAESGQSAYYFTAWKVPYYLFKFLTTDTAYQELRGYWSGMDEGNAFFAAFAGTSIRPFHPLRLLCLLASIVFAGQVLWQAWVRRGILGDFWKALWIAAGANFLLLLATGQYFYPHYSQSLLMFLFAWIVPWVVWVESKAGGWKRWGVLILLFCAGSIEASQVIVRTNDARIGVGVGREVVESILRDADREHWPEGSVVELNNPGLPVQASMYQPLMSEVYHRNFILANNARAQTGRDPVAGYAVVEGDRAGLPGGARPIDGGLMLLYRMK